MFVAHTAIAQFSEIILYVYANMVILERHLTANQIA